MLKAIPAPRPELSKYAPKMLSITIDPVDKIREVIGSGGKVIQKICAECNVKIDIEDDGHVFVSAIDIDDCRSALSISSRPLSMIPKSVLSIRAMSPG